MTELTLSGRRAGRGETFTPAPVGRSLSFQTKLQQQLKQMELHVTGEKIPSFIFFRCLVLCY